MATLLAAADGNLTTNTTWGVVDTTSLVNSQSANTAITTSYVGNTGTTPGAITIDGIAVKIATVSTSPTGTMSVELYNNTLAASVSGTEVTINVSDISQGPIAESATTGSGGGWYLFKFSSTLLLAANSYSVRIKTSSSSMVNCYSTATTNWSCLLRTTTNATPAAGDNFVICGEWTAAATVTARTVTMDSTATTAYGYLSICNNGKLAYGTVASTAYHLKIQANHVNVYGGGTLEIGTAGTPIPSTSTANLEIYGNGASTYSLYVRNLGTITTYGNAITVRSKLAVDAAAAATSLTTSTSTGWKNGDVIVFPSTTATNSQAESKALTADASGTTLTITALTNAHGGDSGTGVQADIANLTRNVNIFGESTSQPSSVVCCPASTTSFSYTGFYNMGTTNASRGAITVGFSGVTATTGSLAIAGCAFYNPMTGASHFMIPRDHIDGFTTTIDNSIFYGNANGTSTGINTSNYKFSPITVTDSHFVKIGFGLYANSNGNCNNISVSGSVFSSGARGINWTGTTTLVASDYAELSMTGCAFYSNSTYGIFTTKNLTVSNSAIWRNNAHGISGAAYPCKWTADTCTIFGNTANGIIIDVWQDVIIRNCTFTRGATIVQPFHIELPVGKALIQNCTSDNTASTGMYLYHDVNATVDYCNIYNNTFQTNLPYTTLAIRESAKSQVRGDDYVYLYSGTKKRDTVIYKTASPSERLTPLRTGIKLPSASRVIAVNASGTSTVTVYYRKSEVADSGGAVYNGNQPRLMLKANASAGITADTVLATASGSTTGSWIALTAATPTVSTTDVGLEVYVDCDGTAGWINVDDWSVS